MKNSEIGPIETQGRGACNMGRGAQKNTQIVQLKWMEVQR